MIRRTIDLIPIGFILLCVAINFAVYFYVESVWILLAYSFVMQVPKSMCSGFGHHMAHSRPFENNRVHMIFEFFTGLVTGILPNFWVLHHNIGHHGARLNTPRDTTIWQDKRGRVYGELECVFWNTVLAYPVAFKEAANKPVIKAATWRWFVATMVVLAALLWYNPVNALLVFIIPMIVGVANTFWHSYYHHVELGSDPMLASRNNTNRIYNLLTCNLGYHTAHHYKQNTHWSELPALHEEIKHMIPPELITDKYWYKFW